MRALALSLLCLPLLGGCGDLTRIDDVYDVAPPVSTGGTAVAAGGGTAAGGRFAVRGPTSAVLPPAEIARNDAAMEAQRRQMQVLQARVDATPAGAQASGSDLAALRQARMRAQALDAARGSLSGTSSVAMAPTVEQVRLQNQIRAAERSEAQAAATASRTPRCVPASRVPSRPGAPVLPVPGC